MGQNGVKRCNDAHNTKYNLFVRKITIFLICISVPINNTNFK